MRRHLSALVVLVVSISCGYGQEKPTKDKALEVLRPFFNALLARDFDTAMKLVLAPGDRAEAARKELKDLITDRHISAKGIAALARTGKWGRLDELFSKNQVESMTLDGKIKVDSCFGLAIEGVGAGFYWDGKQLKILRCVDIGLLQ